MLSFVAVLHFLHSTKQPRKMISTCITESVWVHIHNINYATHMVVFTLITGSVPCLTHNLKGTFTSNTQPTQTFILFVNYLVYINIPQCIIGWWIAPLSSIMTCCIKNFIPCSLILAPCHLLQWSKAMLQVYSKHCLLSVYILVDNEKCFTCI